MPNFAPLPASLPSTVPFTGPENLERQRGAPFTARLGANESGFGPSPRTLEALRDAAAGVWMYGDPDSFALKKALAAHHGVRPENIAVDVGIDGLLGLLVRLMVAEGDAVVTSDGAYPTFNYHVTGFGGQLHKVPYRNDMEDLLCLIREASVSGARLIYFANPDNPMGSWLPGGAIEAALANLPDDTLLILDEAYAELAPAEAIPHIAADDPRVIRMRTFSKAYGMAGARIGYAIGAPDLIAGFDRVRNHFGVNRIAQAGALAALGDQGWLDYVRAEVAISRARIEAIGAENGLTALPSATNFVTLDCGSDGAKARALVAALADEGIFVRMPGVAPLDRCVRISCGPAADMDALAAALPRAIARLG